MGGQVDITQLRTQVRVQPTVGQVGLNQVVRQGLAQLHVVDRQAVDISQVEQRVGANQLSRQVDVSQAGWKSNPRGSERVGMMSTIWSEKQNHLQKQKSDTYGFQQVEERSDEATWTQREGINDGRSASASYQAMGSIHPGGRYVACKTMTYL